MEIRLNDDKSTLSLKALKQDYDCCYKRGKTKTNKQFAESHLSIFAAKMNYSLLFLVLLISTVALVQARVLKGHGPPPFNAAVF
ncbi:hypothetical protein AC249_AIPGENE21405 [Exaiptasia diaphana]|nr:hypothetical protein AC249_AIPGENE21405 [Exaiptasia diaphana]